MEVVANNYMPGDPRLIDQIVYELKSQGIFDHFRKECISDVDTKPAYQNLRQRVEGTVTNFLNQQQWRPDMNKNQVREQLRKNIYESGFLETGVERIVDQVVNPKINTVFLPKVEDVVYRFLGIEKPNRVDVVKKELKVDVIDLLPTDLEAISPESDNGDKKDYCFEELPQKVDFSHSSNRVTVEEDESPAFEPLEVSASSVVPPEENSIDSNLSGFSGLASHESNHSTDVKVVPVELSSQESQISQNSSESRLSIITSDDNTKMDVVDDSHILSKSIKSNEPNLTMEKECEKQEQEKEREKQEDEIKIEKSKNDDKKCEELKIEEKKVRSSDKHKSSKSDREKKVDKERKNSREKSQKSISRHSSSSSIKDKDKKDSKSIKKEKSDKEKNGKDKERVDKDKEKIEKEKPDKDKSDREKSDRDKEKSHRKDKTDKHDRDKRDKDKNDKSDKHDKDRGDKDKGDKYERDRTEKNDKVKHEKHNKDKSEKSNKENHGKDKKRSSSSNEKHSKTSSKKEASASSSKEKEKEKSRSSSSSHKEKKSSSDSKPKSSSSSEKHKKEDKHIKNKHSSSSSKKEKHKDKKPKDDHYSSKEKKTDRRSTDRDSNDGSSKPSRTGSNTQINTQIQKSSQESSSFSSGSGSGDSGNSDQDLYLKVESNESEKGPLCTDIQQIKYIKPKFASNIHEAMKIMKIRKQLARLERQNQLALAHVEVNKVSVAETSISGDKPIQNGLADDFKKVDTQEGDGKNKMEVAESITAKETVEETCHQRTDLSRENWEALEARLAQEMSNISNCYGYDDSEDIDYHNNSIIISPVKRKTFENDKKNGIVLAEILEIGKVNSKDKHICQALEESNNKEVKENFTDNNSDGINKKQKVDCDSDEKLTEDNINDVKSKNAIEDDKENVCQLQQIMEVPSYETEENVIPENTIIEEAKENKEDINIETSNDLIQNTEINIESCDEKNKSDLSTGDEIEEESIDPESCMYLEKPSVSMEKSLQYIYSFINKLQKDVEEQSLKIQNNIPPVRNNRGRKRKFQDSENNNKIKYVQRREMKRTKSNATLAKMDTEKMCTSTDISTNESFTLPLSPAESDKSFEIKKEDVPTIKSKRLIGKVAAGKGQRYSSDDLYKPRPVFTSSRRSRGAKNVDC